MRAPRTTDRIGCIRLLAPLIVAAGVSASVLASGCASRSPESAPASAPPASSDAGAGVLAPPVSSEVAERERAARRAVQDARAFLIQDRPEAALRATARGLFAMPEDPALLRERARALDALGRADEAAGARALADRIAPPPPPLPNAPLPGRFDDLLVVMQSPDLDFGSERTVREARSAIDWKPAVIARLRMRLPGVEIVEETEAEAPSVPAARHWLRSHGRPRIAAMHIVRAFCGESVKDGRYAVATIHRTRLAAESPSAASTSDDDAADDETDDRDERSESAEGPEEDDARADGAGERDGSTDVIDGPVRWSGIPADVPAAVATTGTAAGKRSQGGADGCELGALYRAVERWLAEPSFAPPVDRASASVAPPPVDRTSSSITLSSVAPPSLGREAILALLPGLGARVQAEHVSARRALFVGDLERARAAYLRARALDPEDEDIQEHLAELEATLELNRELAELQAEREREMAQRERQRAHRQRERAGPEQDRAARDGAATERNAAPESAGWLPAELSPAQSAALESQLEAERRRRDDLLATLATVSGDRRSAHVPEAALRDSELLDPTAKGPRRALAMLGAEDEAGVAGERLAVETLHAPSGALLARYYFDADARVRGEGDESSLPPILVEEDESGDGELDRWTAYREGMRIEVWEERRDQELPDLHAVYADDGRTLVRLELDDARAGQPDRVYEYEGGQLVRAAHDTDGDGRLDRFDRFDEEGRVSVREEDVTGDGRIDVRSTFERGRLVKRELMGPLPAGNPKARQ